MSHVHSWTVGDVQITKIVELEAPLPLGGDGSMLPDAFPAAVAAIPGLAPAFATAEGHVLMSVHSFLVQTPTRRIVVDTCVGNGKERSNPLFNGLASAYLDDFRAAGWVVEDVDAVLCTHLHSDHVGWNTVRDGERWVPTFPRAKYCLSRSEFEHWSKEPHGTDADLLRMDSVQPIVDAGLLELVDDATETLGSEFTLRSTPGHTPGHVSALITSNGEQAIITGDVLHSACQVAHPEWCATFDSDQDAAEATRRQFLAEYADKPVLVLGTHFGGTTAGYIVTDGAGYRFVV